LKKEAFINYKVFKELKTSGLVKIKDYEINSWKQIIINKVDVFGKRKIKRKEHTILVICDIC
jgi:hypothetical protein